MTLLTEAQAAKRWCPFTRNGNEAGCNRSGDSFPMSICIGSQCMAWRWDIVGNEAAEREHEDSSAVGGVYIREEPTPRGYCGLAGKVEP